MHATVNSNWRFSRDTRVICKHYEIAWGDVGLELKGSWPLSHVYANLLHKKSIQTCFPSFFTLPDNFLCRFIWHLVLRTRFTAPTARPPTLRQSVSRPPGNRRNSVDSSKSAPTRFAPLRIFSIFCQFVDCVKVVRWMQLQHLDTSAREIRIFAYDASPTVAVNCVACATGTVAEHLRQRKGKNSQYS